MSAFDSTLIHGQHLALRIANREELCRHAQLATPETRRAYASQQSATIITSTRTDLSHSEQARILELYISWGLPTYSAVSAALDHPDPAFAHQFAQGHGGVSWALRTLDPLHPRVRALIQYDRQLHPDIRTPAEYCAY